jgi:hypothetical protein
MEDIEKHFDSYDSLDKHNELMGYFELPDKESKIWLYKRILSHYIIEGLNLMKIAEDVFLRVYTPLGNKIAEAAQNENFNNFPELLVGYKLIVFWIDKLPIADIVPINTPEYTEEYVEALRWNIGPLYPDKIERHSIILATSEYPNGPKVEFANWGTSEGIFLKNLFKEYNKWFENHTKNLTPQFQVIADEIRDFLKSGYQINPNKGGFIKWFIAKKLGTVKFKLTGNFNSPLATLQTDYRDLSKTITPTIVDEDLHAYCKWKHDQQNELFSKVNQQKEISQPDLTTTQTDNNHVIRPFPDLLAGNYTKSDLDRLLVHLRMRDNKGKNIWPQGKKAGLYGVIDALELKSYLIETTGKERMSSLSNYLGLKDSRVKDGYAKIQTDIKHKAISFLNQSVK